VLATNSNVCSQGVEQTSRGRQAADPRESGLGLTFLKNFHSCWLSPAEALPTGVGARETDRAPAWKGGAYDHWEDQPENSRRASIRSVLDAPPVLKASDHSVGYTCGHCGTTLLHAEENQVHGVLLRYTNCGSYNSSDL
jgi:hypothetical protein